MQHVRLLGSALVILLGGTLALNACNSSSVSGSQSKPSTSTNAQTKSAGQSPQGLAGAAFSKTR
jgi:hypothetical protein